MASGCNTNSCREAVQQQDGYLRRLASMNGNLTLRAQPEGPFRTKNNTAPESVVFCYRRSFFTLCTVFLPLCPRKTSISERSPYRFATAVANWLPVLNFLSVLNLLSVLFLVREGPLGSPEKNNIAWILQSRLKPSISEVGRIRFRRVRFQTPNSVSFFALTEFRGENSVSSSQPTICVPKRAHRVFRRTHRVCPKTREAQWLLFSETVLSKQHAARFLQSRLKHSILTFRTPQKKKRPWQVARLKYSFSIENFNPGGRYCKCSLFGKCFKARDLIVIAICIKGR